MCIRDRDTEEALLAAQREREEIRHQKKREIRRDYRMSANQFKKAKLTRDGEREITEKIALGVAQPTTKESLFDQRLFNQTSGLEAGFGSDDDYNLYDKPCLLYTSPSPRDLSTSRMPSSA
eukprot:TRINITY_DN27341_c0_g1_i3.p1 TRINITY_DN27341_c0_g1~~TRINITY_DN27341_c0_g1_i3.p1  ORF type:complete len:138 (-),score=25.69 TRINITY_DN27341_c0_g1_i3:74-436(-)